MLLCIDPMMALIPIISKNFTTLLPLTIEHMAICVVKSIHIQNNGQVNETINYWMLVLCFSPITYSWEGGVQLANDPNFSSMVVTRAQFEEHGHNICMEKFDVWLCLGTQTQYVWKIFRSDSAFETHWQTISVEKCDGWLYRCGKIILIQKNAGTQT